MDMRLTGDKNQCQGCKAYFNSTYAFDKHRTGEFGKDRRCRTEDEMRAIGMDVNAKGFWVGEPFNKNAILGQWQMARSDLNREAIPKPTLDQKIAEITDGAR